MALAPVPDEFSLTRHVEREWKEINHYIHNGLPYSFRASLIDERIQERRVEIEAGRLNPSYDWLGDLQRAERTNSHNVGWVDNNKDLRERFFSHWQALTKRTLEYSEKIVVAGFSTVLLLHGAVAVGSLNALAQKSGQLSVQFILAAKWAMFGALVGILLLAVGQIISLEALTRLANTVNSKLLKNPKLKSFNAVAKYWTKYHRKYVNLGSNLIYGSIFWFFFYCAVAYVMLLGA